MRGGLLERDAELQRLHAAMSNASGGRGSVILVSGEAGVGKSSLIGEFARAAEDGARVWLGSCDDLITPRSYGPLRDIARQVGGDVGARLAATDDRDELLGLVLDELSYPLQPTVVVIEDVHWADDATLDLIRCVGRRIARMPSVLVLTYRDDELGADHPLRRVLGGLVGPEVQRMPLGRLSREAVRSLAGDRGLDGDEIYAATGGNAFFVSEILAAPEADVPGTVRDAVLARIDRLDAPTREALQVLSVVPAQVEDWLAERLLDERLDVLGEAERRGVLVVSPYRIRFRHELARRAIEQTLPTVRRTSCHRRVLRALASTAADPARVMHHAVEAGDVEAIVAHGPEAARHAARCRSHRQAVAHAEQVLRHADRLEERERAALLTEYAYELYHVQRFGDGADAAAEAAGAWERLGVHARLGEALCIVARAGHWAGRRDQAMRAAHRAVATLEPLGESAALATAYASVANLHMMADDLAAVDWARKAHAVARALDRQDLVAHALNYEGTVRMSRGDPAGEEQLQQALSIVRGLHEPVHVARACANLVRSLLRQARHTEGDAYIKLGLSYAREDEFQLGITMLESYRAHLQAFRGEWDHAIAGLRALLAEQPDAGVLGALPRAILGRLLLRRDDPTAEELIEHSWEIAIGSGEHFFVSRAAIARVEAAWLRGDRPGAVAAAELSLRQSEEVGDAPHRGQLLAYLHRAGEAVEPFDGCPPEYALQLTGDWRGAAEAWAARGNPYERALCLADSGDPQTTLGALEILDELDAKPVAALVRRRLRDLGVRRVPRGPLAVTRENPAGLTTRQVDVLGLLAGGLTNAEIAERLVVSTRTVDHHVSAILAKLEVGSRREAALAAARLGIVPEAPTR